MGVKPLWRKLTEISSAIAFSSSTIRTLGKCERIVINLKKLVKEIN
jgi:hypothetical protein